MSSASLSPKRIDLETIASLVQAQSRVLDIGCGDGALLALMEKKQHIRGFGIELSQEGVNACVARGLNVVKGDAETDLSDYPDGAFDYVILSQTIQAMRHPDEIIAQMLRIGKFAIVSLPNFGFWRVRFYLLFYGRMPRASLLPYEWHDTPNIHLCTITDFMVLVKQMGLTINHFLALSVDKRLSWLGANGWANWFAQQAIFVLENPVKEKHHA